jgi:hypothetical protein
MPLCPRCRHQAPSNITASFTLAGTACGLRLGLQLPSLTPCRCYALACPCVPRGHLPNASLSSSATDADVQSNFPLTCPSRNARFRYASLSLRCAPPEHVKSTTCAMRVRPAVRVRSCAKCHPVLFHPLCVRGYKRNPPSLHFIRTKVPLSAPVSNYLLPCSSPTAATVDSATHRLSASLCIS